MLLFLLLLLAALCMPAFGQTTAKSWYEKGLAFYYQGKYDEAIQAYDEAIKINPQDADSWNEKGNALIGQSKYEEAIQALDKAIDIDP